MKNLILLPFLALAFSVQAQLNLKWSNIHSLSGGMYPSQAYKIPCCIDCCLDIYVPGNEHFEQTLDSVKGTIAKCDTSGALLWITPLTPSVSLSEFGTFHTGAGLTASAKSYVAGSPVVVAYNTTPTISRLIRVDTAGNIVMNVVVSGVDRIMDIETDSLGNIYAVGRTPQSTCSGSPCNGIAVAKYDFSGTQLWKKTKYTSGYKSEPVDLILDDAGNVIVCGKKAASTSNSAFYDKSFVVKFSNSGAQVWAKEYTAYHQIVCCIEDGVDNIMELEVDETGDVHFTDTQVDTTTLIPSVKLRKKAALTGNVLFTKTISNAESSGTWILCCDTGEGDWFSVLGTSSGMRAYNSAGQQKWSNSYIVKTGIICCDEDNGIIVVATNVSQTEPLSKFLLELDGNTGTVLYQKNLSFGNHQEYEGDYEAISKDQSGNVYLLINDTVPPYGTRATRLTNCDNFTTSFTGSVTNGKTINNASCNNGQFRVNYSGTWNSWPHFEVWNSNQTTLVYASDPSPGAAYQLVTNLAPAVYVIKVYDESCGEQVFTKTLNCNQPATPTTTTNITANTAKANWNTPPCNVGTYKLQYRLSGSNQWTTVSNVNATNYTITGLQPATAYQWKVAAKCNTTGTIVYSNYSALRNFTTATLREGNDYTIQAGNDISIEINPNPVGDKLMLIPGENISNAWLKIYNAQGQLVIEKNIKTWNENEMMEIQTTVLSKGIYLLQIISGKGCFTERFLKE